MKYALIGCGRIASNHIAAAVANKLEIVAVCDISERHMEELLAKHNLATSLDINRYTDYRDMLKDESDIELIAIATESGSHASIALDCIEATKHLIIEKPIAMSVSDANSIIEAAAKKNVLVSACHQNRFNDAIQKLRKAREANRFGKLSHGSIHVRWNRGKSYYDQAPWRGTWEQDGGCLMNQCIHGIDLLCWMMDSKITSVYAQTRQRFHDYLEAEDIGVAVLSFENGSVATIEGTTNVYPQNLEESLCLFGEKGTVKIGGKSVNSIEVWDFADVNEKDKALKNFSEQVPNIYGNGHTLLYADMQNAIQENRIPYVDATAGRDALEVILAIYKSQKTGEPVKLPLKDFASIDMKGTFDALS